MGNKNLAFKIEDLFTEAEKIDSMNEALFQAVFRGDNDPAMYEWAFIAFRNMTFELREQMKDLTDESFKLMRGEKEQ